MLVLLLALAVRSYQLAGQSLWADEGNSIALARAGLAEIAARTALDIHPPLYYWLLHGWMQLAGDGEVAVRSLSVFAGVLLVAVTYQLGRSLFGRRVGLLAAVCAALSPFQVYYAQETRMYALSALWGALLVSAAARLYRVAAPGRPAGRAAFALYALSATLGLYTHYAFAAVLAAAALGGLVYLWQTRRQEGLARRAAGWLAAQLLPVVLFLPWLPIAWRQLTTWPAPAPASPVEAAATVWRTLAMGPAVTDASPLALAALGVLAALGAIRLVRSAPAAQAGLVLLVMALPVGLTLALFKPAYLKFLLVASPAWCLLLALALEWPAGWSPVVQGGRRAVRQMPGAGWAVQGAGLLLIAGAAWGPLVSYFGDPALARDDYRGLANYLEAVGGPQDAILLNAPGQQEVFGYYYRGRAPVVALPRARPLDAPSTVAELEGLLAGSRYIYASYWAAAESDPDGLIEGWLEGHAFKAGERWVGNLRLASYAAPRPAGDLQPVSIRLGDAVMLTGYRVAYPGPDPAEALAQPGDILQVQLRWSTDAPLSARTMVFLQALDGAGHLVGQRDAPPAVPAPEWRPGQAVLDRLGLPIAPGTPPGQHRIIVGLYDALTGQRLPVSAPAPGMSAGSDAVELGTFRVERPTTAAAAVALGLRHAVDIQLGDLALLGYDRYPTGHDHTPDTPLRPGAPLHVVLFWQALRQPAVDWQATLSLAPADAPDSPVAEARLPAAGVDYPAHCWQPGEIVRAQFDVFVPAEAAPGTYSIRLRLVGGAGEPLELAPVVIQ